MAVVAYARVSSADQSLDIQFEQLTAAGAERIFAEKITGTTTDGREELENCLAFVREGDTLMVTRLDRLARSTGDLLRILAVLEEKHVGFKCIHQPVDTTTSAGRLFITILGAIGEFETAIRKERQREGIEAAIARGTYHGSKKTINADRIIKLAMSGHSVTEIAEKTGYSRKSVYRHSPGMWIRPEPKPKVIKPPRVKKEKVVKPPRVKKPKAVKVKRPRGRPRVRPPKPKAPVKLTKSGKPRKPWTRRTVSVVEEVVIEPQAVEAVVAPVEPAPPPAAPAPEPDALDWIDDLDMGLEVML